MSDPRRAPGADLPQWIEHVAGELGVDPGLIDVDRILAVAGDVAHAVARPAAPLTMAVVGLAMASGRADALEVVEREARAWAAE